MSVQRERRARARAVGRPGLVVPGRIHRMRILAPGRGGVCGDVVDMVYRCEVTAATGGSGGSRDGEPIAGELSPEWTLPAAAAVVESYVFVIHGSPPSKNDQRPVIMGGAPCPVCRRRRGSLSIIGGDRTKEWKRNAWVELGEQMRALRLRVLRTPVRLSGVVYWKTRASDMAVEVIQDALQGPIIRGKRGSGRGHNGLVIVDDKQVMEYGQWVRRFDTQRPRVELLVETLAAEQESML